MRQAAIDALLRGVGRVLGECHGAGVHLCALYDLRTHKLPPFSEARAK